MGRVDWTGLEVIMDSKVGRGEFFEGDRGCVFTGVGTWDISGEDVSGEAEVVGEEEVGVGEVLEDRAVGRLLSSGSGWLVVS
jgi:hypothetical protein